MVNATRGILQRRAFVIWTDLFRYLGETRIKVLRQWARIKLHITRDENLQRKKYAELWDTIFDHYSEKENPQHFFDLLLLVLMVRCFAVDTAICERGFSLMNLLKTARRSTMGSELLRSLMVICCTAGPW